MVVVAAYVPNIQCSSNNEGRYLLRNQKCRACTDHPRASAAGEGGSVYCIQYVTSLNGLAPCIKCLTPVSVLINASFFSLRATSQRTMQLDKINLTHNSKQQLVHPVLQGDLIVVPVSIKKAICWRTL